MFCKLPKVTQIVGLGSTATSLWVQTLPSHHTDSRFYHCQTLKSALLGKIRTGRENFLTLN